MTTLSDKAAAALQAAVASKGKSKGLLLAKAPPSRTLAYAAWMGAQIVCNPFKVSIGGVMFLSDEQREVYREVEAALSGVRPRPRLDSDRNALESLGVW